MKDIEVSIADAENICDVAKVEHGYVPDDHVPMALVRAVNAACTQLGIEPPGKLFAEVSGGLRDARDINARAQLETINGTLAHLGYTGTGSFGVSEMIADLRGSIGGLTEQSAMITQALEEAGFAGRVDTGSVLTAIADLRKQASVARALGDGFSEALAEARDAYDRAALTGRELNARERAGDQRPIEPERAETFREAANALGHLLAEMRKINPRPVVHDGGGTTITLTEAVEIGTPATAPGAAQ